MRKAILSLLHISVLSLFLVGCTNTYVSQFSAPLEVKFETQKVPMVDVGPEIKGHAVIHRLLFFTWGVNNFADGVNYGGGSESIGFSLDTNYNEGKAAAAYDACNRNNADVIIAPRYTLTNENYWVYSKTAFVVKGYKGTFKGPQKK